MNEKYCECSAFCDETASVLFDILTHGIDAAPRNAVPVFNGLAELHSTLLRADAFLRKLSTHPTNTGTSEQEDGHHG